jgi:hypothetical protein
MKQGHSPLSAETKPELLKQKLNGSDLVNFGIEEIAYVKSVTVDGNTMHAIHAADGTPLTVVADRKIAFATVSQHDMQPLSVH